MKIYSKFQDYYDSMRCYAICSDDFIYKRKTEEIELDKRYCFTLIDYTDDGFEYDIETFIIGFCGKFYQGFKLKIPDEYDIKRSIIHYNVKIPLQTSIDSKFIKKHFKQGNLNWGFKRSKGKTWQDTKYNIVKHKSERIKYEFEKFTKEYEKLNLFEEYNTPVFLLQSSKYNRNVQLIINPCLKDYSFFKVFEGHYAYQEIEMFIGNILLKPDNPPQIIDDLVLAQQKGFNDMSFRKYPTKRKK